MAITKQKKTEIVAKLQAALSEAASVAFVAFKGVSAGDAMAMRKELRAQGVGYLVAKKTLIKRALADRQVSGTLPDLPGEIAVAYSMDAVAPAREVHAFGKKAGGALSLVGGIFENRYIGKQEVVELASIPGREVLYGQLVGLMVSPIRSFAVALSQIAEKRA
jgi:large subunit ribosomal protein L10